MDDSTYYNSGYSCFKPRTDEAASVLRCPHVPGVPHTVPTTKHRRWIVRPHGRSRLTTGLHPTIAHAVPLWIDVWQEQTVIEVWRGGRRNQRSAVGHHGIATDTPAGCSFQHRANAVEIIKEGKHSGSANGKADRGSRGDRLSKGRERVPETRPTSPSDLPPPHRSASIRRRGSRSLRGAHVVSRIARKISLKRP